MKVLYTFYHGAAFAWSLVHALSRHKNDKVYMLVANGWDWCVGAPKLLPLLLEFQKRGFINGVYIYDNRLGRDKNIFDSVEKTEHEILTQMDECLMKQGINIEEFNEIYSNTDGEDTMGIYLSLKRKSFHWFEFGKNLLTLRTEDWIMNTYHDHAGYKGALLKHKTLFGGNSLQSYILYPDSSAGKFEKSKIQIFDAKKAADELDLKCKETILEIFGIDKSKLLSQLESSAVLYLQSNWLPDQVFSSCEEIRKVYKHHFFYMYSAIQHIMDYYVPDGVEPILKTHPTVGIDEAVSKKYFKGAYAFPPLFTALLTNALLPHFSAKYNVLLGSTVNDQVKNESEDIRCPGVWLFPDLCEKYYVTCDVLRRLGTLSQESGKYFETIGSSGLIMDYNTILMQLDINNLIKINFNAAGIVSCYDCRIIQDKYDEIENAVIYKDFVIYTDVWQKLPDALVRKWGEKGLLTVIEIKKEPVKPIQDILKSLDTEFIYVLTRNDDIKKKVRSYTGKKKNDALGFHVYARSLSQEEMTRRFQIGKEYEVGTAINLWDCYCNNGLFYKDKHGNEIEINGTINGMAEQNMHAISIKFSGSGNNKVLFNDLTSIQKFSGNFRIEVLNGGTIEIGRFLFVNSSVLIHAAHANIKIGEDVMFASNVMIRAMNYHSIYGLDGKRLKNRDVYVGDHVWLGWGTTLYAGSVIGTGSVIEAGSVVGGEIPNNVIAIGNPARVVRRDIFWNWFGTETDYDNLPDCQQIADEYRKPTDEGRKVREYEGDRCNSGTL